MLATSGLATALRAAPAAGVYRSLPRLWALGFATDGAAGSKGTPDDATTEASAAVAAVGSEQGPPVVDASAPAASTSAGTSAAGPADYHSLAPRVVVFGGNGFVGSHVCQQALAMGADVVSINRSGRPSNLRGDWLAHVQWVQGDALDPQQPWKELLRGAAGVVSTMGAFGSNDYMYKICGETNMRVMDASAAAGVTRFSFISVHEFKLPAGWRAQDFLLKGYFRGKRDAEAHMQALFPTGGVALRPGMIYGTRAVGSGQVHLEWIGAPLKAALSVLPTHTLANIPIVGAAFVPPVSVDAVARAAVSAVLDPAVPPGVMSVWDIQKYA
ncbi:hypothetical protein ABPG77_001661 [Micractinium sp. CCAP 211/92]